jgi:hypothetical protein
MYQWFVFVHLAGVFGLLASHGVSMGVMFRLRGERDPARVDSLLQISALSVGPFYISLLVLLVGGVVAGFLGDLWSYGWIWGSIAVLVLIMVVMYAMARPYYQRVRFIARAMAEGTEAVSQEQWERILRSGRPMTAARKLDRMTVVLARMIQTKPAEAGPVTCDDLAAAGFTNADIALFARAAWVQATRMLGADRELERRVA